MNFLLFSNEAKTLSTVLIKRVAMQILIFYVTTLRPYLEHTTLRPHVAKRGANAPSRKHMNFLNFTFSLNETKVLPGTVVKRVATQFPEPSTLQPRGVVRTT
jgi:hypothetical protein